MTTQTHTQQFAEKYAEGVVPGMLRAIKLVKLANKGILLGALAISYLHQQRFLASQGFGVFSYIAPAVFDLSMVAMMIVTQTIGMHPEAKRAAVKVLAATVLLSAGINFAAPGTMFARCVFAAIVALVAAVEYVSAKIRPDFSAIEARETEAVASTSVVKPRRTLTEEQKAARNETRRANAEAKRLAQMSPQQRAAETRRRNASAPRIAFAS